MFEISLDEKNKIFIVSASGIIDEDEALGFLNGVREKVNVINTDEYSLILDIQRIELASIKTMFLLSQVMDLYKQTSFNTIFAVVEDINLVRSQIEKIEKQLNSNIVLAKSIRDAIDNITE